MVLSKLFEAVNSLGIANLIALTTLIVTLLFALKQIVEMKRATYATAFSIAIDKLQADDNREARKILLTELKDKKLSDWTNQDKLTAEKVGQSYDVVAIMVRNKILPVKVIADSWGDSLRRTWKIIEPLANKYREERSSSEFWDDYEWLAKKAKKYKKPYKQKLQKKEEESIELKSLDVGNEEKLH